MSGPGLVIDVRAAAADGARLVRVPSRSAPAGTLSSSNGNAGDESRRRGRSQQRVPQGVLHRSLLLNLPGATWATHIGPKGFSKPVAPALLEPPHGRQ